MHFSHLTKGVLSGLLLTLIVTIGLSFSFRANAYTENKKCCIDRVCGQGGGDTVNDDWSRYTHVSIPIPGVTHTLYCSEYKNNQWVTLNPYYAVEDLAHYLAGFYRYFVGIVGIIAATMIMYGGIRWILAAGNRSRIQDAKNVIFSAIIGLLIAFLSYLLLYLLNPRLVDYETLSKTLSLNAITPIASDLEYCVDHDKDQNKPLEVNNDSTKPFKYYCIDGAGDGSCRVTTQVVADYYCGDKYAILPRVLSEDKKTETYPICYGKKCDIGSACIKDEESSINPYSCIPSMLYGDINYSGNAYIDFIWLGVTCSDGSTHETEVLDVSEGAHFYNIIRFYTNIINSYKTLCGGDPAKDHVRYYLKVEVNDDSSFGFTTDDDFVVGNNCMPLTGKAPSDISESEWQQYFNSGKMFTYEELMDGNNIRRCDFNINRSAFPSR